METSVIQQSLDDRIDQIIDDCTTCGACVRICPTPSITGNNVSDDQAVAQGVINILKDKVSLHIPDPAKRWATECCLTGRCLDVCEVGINPRFMLTMARLKLACKTPSQTKIDNGKSDFKTMSQGVRILSRMQLSQDQLERLKPRQKSSSKTQHQLIFYTGCNLLKTPHIVLQCLDILGKLNINYDIMGGPSHCCGILQLRTGDDGNAIRQAAKTIERFADHSGERIVSWCPTCQIQFSENMKTGNSKSNDMTIWPVFLAQRLDKLRPLMRHPVHKKIALHEYPGSPGVVESVKALLRAVPGVELLELENPGIGYQLSSLNDVPDEQKRHLATTLKTAKKLGVTTLAGIYHADHRELVAHETQWPFEIVNYMDIISQSMGFQYVDQFKRLKHMQDIDLIIQDCQDLIDQHSLKTDDVRQVITRDIIDSQCLPIDPAEHP